MTMVKQQHFQCKWKSSQHFQNYLPESTDQLTLSFIYLTAILCPANALLCSNTSKAEVTLYVAHAHAHLQRTIKEIFMFEKLVVTG